MNHSFKNIFLLLIFVLLNTQKGLALPLLAGSNLVSGEYFWNNDPGFGNANAFTVSANDTVNFAQTV
ncbi:hypothetical protein IT568_07305, partial [bacterium]|nr:hypothetical protein [bacterium]